MPKHKTHVEDAGGVRQRSKRLKSQAESLLGAQVDSETHDNARPELDCGSLFHWLQKWSWGKISSAEVQREALRSHNDFQRTLGRIPLSEDYMPNSLLKVAQLGHWEIHPGNVNRDLKHWLGESVIPDAHVTTVPMASTKLTSAE